MASKFVWRIEEISKEKNNEQQKFLAVVESPLLRKQNNLIRLSKGIEKKQISERKIKELYEYKRILIFVENRTFPKKHSNIQLVVSNTLEFQPEEFCSVNIFNRKHIFENIFYLKAGDVSKPRIVLHNEKKAFKIISIRNPKIGKVRSSKKKP